VLAVRNGRVLGLDRAPAAVTVDVDGRLRVAGVAISKAAISPYYGREIGGWNELLLEPDKVYQLYRPAAELERAASTFSGVPLLRRHTPVNAAAPQKNEIIGAIGSDCVFEDPFLNASLTIWSKKDGVDAIRSGRRDLSAGYHYRVDLSPGLHDGVRFDGRMVDLCGNHVALVDRGRVGECAIEIGEPEFAELRC
jgi:uncharacterized protein